MAVAAAVQGGQCGAHGDGLAGADLAGDHADAAFGDAPADAGDRFVVGGVAVQHARGQIAPERHPGETEVRDQVVHHRGCGLLAGEQVELAGDLVAGPGEGGVVDAAGQFGCMRGLDQPRVVDAGGLRWRATGFRVWLSDASAARCGAGSPAPSARRPGEPRCGSGRTGRTPTPPCDRPAPGRPRSCCRAATPSRSWSRGGAPPTGTPR